VFVSGEAPEDRAVQRLRTLIAQKAQSVPPGSSKQRWLLDKLALSDEGLLDAFFAELQPNPDRVGCPPRPVLIELAQRTRPLTDPWWDHLMECSPCRIDVRELGRAFPATPKRLTWRGRRAVGALLVAVGLTVSFLVGRWTKNAGRLIATNADLRGRHKSQG
jgi:hypothetical protein